jgi:hypothetical protein
VSRRFRFRDPPFKWRVILVAAALATPGYLAGGMASLWLGDFDTCSAAGAMLGAVGGVGWNTGRTPRLMIRLTKIR